MKTEDGPLSETQKVSKSVNLLMEVCSPQVVITVKFAALIPGPCDPNFGWFYPACLIQDVSGAWFCQELSPQMT